MSNTEINRDLTTFSLTIGCTKKIVGTITQPKRAYWKPKLWMKVWRMPDGSAQVRKKRPKAWKGNFLGRYGNETTVWIETFKTISDVVAPSTRKRKKTMYYVHGMPGAD